ncbi:MAG TPA: O-antigen ligase family protein [Candidatus Limnocylindria bacterium]|nr:O-antigen ligase family protein [Candidatus Limnocylindria bacterium]
MTTATITQRLQPRGATVLGVIAALGAAGVMGLVATLTNSPLALLAGGVLALGTAMLFRPELGVILFLALLWMNVPAVLVTFHHVPGFVVEASILLLLVPVAKYLLQRQPVVITPASIALLIYVGANLLSSATSTNPALATQSVVTLLGEGLLIYALASNAIRSPRVAQYAVRTLVVAAVVMAALAIHQEVTQSYDDPYLGFARIKDQAEIITGIPNPDDRPRSEGPVGETNRFAQVLLVVVPLALTGMGIRHALLGRVLPAAASLVIATGVLLTFSRGAAVAMGLLAVVLVLKRYVKLRHMLAVILAFMVSVFAVAPEFIARVESIGAVAGWVSGDSDAPDGAVLGRTTSNVAALLVFVDHPIAGVGPGVYAQDYSIEYANRLGLRFFLEERRAHNMYVEWAAELGIIGLTSGLAMIALTMTQLSGLRNYWLTRRRDYADLAGAFWLAVLMYASTAVFLHLSYARYFFGLLALANSVIWVLQQERKSLGNEAPAAQLPNGALEAIPAGAYRLPT